MLLKTKEETTQNIAKESLSSKITEEEIQVLLSGQAEIVELEKAIIEYRKSSYYGIGGKVSIEVDETNDIEEILKENSVVQQAETHQVIDLDKHFEKKEQLRTQIEIPPK